MTPPPNPPPSPPPYPSVDVVYDEVKAITDSVLDERGALNTRASFILGSASILIGAVTGILGVAATFHPVQRSIVHWGITVGLLIYLVVVYFAWRAYKEDSFEVIKPFRLTDYLDYQEYDTKRYMIRTRLDNYLLDRDTLARKTGFTVVALAALLVEVVWLALILLVIAIVSG